MKRPYPGLALRTAAFVALLGLQKKPIEESTLAEIQARRAFVFPTRPPFTWITGRLDPTVRISDGAVPVRDGSSIPIRWYRPSGEGGPLPLVVYFHGGGWVQGSTRMYDPLCTALAARVGAVVASVDYRLAPEFAAPTAAHDAIDAVRALIDGSEQPAIAGIDGTRVGLAGDSAGGNLAAVVAQQLGDLRGPDGRPVIRHQALIYPATDQTLGSPSIEEHAEAPILTKAGIMAFRDLYLGPSWTTEQLHDPLLSPLYGDVEGVAPALIQTAGLDPIRDDGSRYAEHLRAAGVEARLTCYHGLPHGFASFPGACPAGPAARDELVDEIARHLS